MSILQEYEEIRREMGEIKWSALKKYLSDKKDILLSDVLYNEEQWNKFDNWYNQLLKNKKEKIRKER